MIFGCTILIGMAENGYSKNYFTLKNILIYVVIGIIVYGLVYYFFFMNNTSPTNPYGDSSATQEEASTTMTVPLAAQNDSEQTGTATFTESNGQTTVVVNVSNAPEGVEQPAHIHTGACPTPGGIVYPLTNLVNGTSETVLDADIATIWGQLPLAVNVHQSVPDASVYVACGDLQ